MTTVMVVNPRAGAGRAGRALQQITETLARHFGPVQTRVTGRAGEATTLTRRALAEGAERIVAVGGDGTVNEIVNGFADESGRWLGADASLAYYPLGTGGDFSRSLGLSGVSMRRALAKCTPKVIDVGRAELTGADGAPVIRYFANISSFGSSGLVVRKVNEAPKHLGSRLSFVIGTVRALAAYSNQRVRLQIDDHFDEEVTINTVVAANGRYFGGSMKVAPDALLDDGLFDVVIMGDVGLATFLRYGPRIYKGTHVTLPGIRVMRGRRVVATPVPSDEEVLVDLDGEQPGRLPITYQVVPGALSVLAPWQDVATLRPTEAVGEG